MIAFLAKARAYLGVITAGVIAFLVLLAKYFKDKADRATRRAKRTETQILRKEEMDEVEAEIDAEYSDLERASKEDRANGQVPEHLSDPDDF